MNIFILSRTTSPQAHYRTNAKYHCNKHVVKMIAESTQMLVSACYYGHPLLQNMHDRTVQFPCKPLSAGMLKHPCTVWTCFNLTHTNYLCRLALALVDEHQYRYPLSPEHVYAHWLRILAMELWELGYNANSPLPKQFAVAVKDPALRSTSTPHQDAVDIYRRYYHDDKAAFASWKNRELPPWWLAASTY